MITGRDTLQEISNHVLQAQSRIEAIDREMDGLNTQLNQSRIETAEQYRELATFRLDEIRAGNVTSRMNKAYLAVPAFMDQHKQVLAALENDITQEQQRQQMLEQQRETRRDARDTAGRKQRPRRFKWPAGPMKKRPSPRLTWPARVSLTRTIGFSCTCGTVGTSHPTIGTAVLPACWTDGWPA